MYASYSGIVKHNTFDDYLARVTEPARSTCEAVRQSIHQLVPNLEECISYGIPSFRTPQGVVAGIAVNKNFCSYYPFSGSVLDSVAEYIAGYGRTKSALHFAFDQPLSPAIIKILIDARLVQLSEK